jgi:FG-GAP repeat protein/VCBS repeat protein
MGTKNRALAACAAAGLFIGSAQAQELLHTFRGGDIAGLGLGQVVAAAGDFNRDGFGDLIVGYRFGSQLAGVNAGSARVFSGRDGSVLATFVGDTAQDNFGRSVAGAGDVNGDGFADVVVGAPLDDNNGLNSGSAKVFSGATGALLYTFNGSAKHLLGVAVAGVGDLNGDGRADVLVGANPDLTLPLSHGYAKVFSGMDGSVLFTFTGAVKTSRLGFAVASAGDVNADGTPDLVIGDPRDPARAPAAGSIKVYSGLNGALLFTFLGDAANDQLGLAVAGAGDLNGDGHADLIGGTPWSNSSVVDSGLARVWSGATGAVMFEFRGEASLDFFGASVAGNTDVDADGVPDLIIGAFADDDAAIDSGSVRVYSGVDGSVLHRLDGDSAADEFGFAVCAAGDVNGDGGQDFAIGAPADDAGGGFRSGSVRVFAGVAPATGAVSFCTTSPNSLGAGAVMGREGSMSLAANDLVLTVSGAPPGRFGMFLFSPEKAEVPFGSGVLCLGKPIRPIPPVERVGTDGVASRRIDFTAPRGHLELITPDSVWNFQFIYRDQQPHGHGKGHEKCEGASAVNLSDGLELTFVP